jgi:nitroreductase
MTMSAIATSETIDLLHSRASVRAFSAEPVPADLLDDLLAAGLRAPTSFNLQAYSFVVVRDPDRRRALAGLVNQAHVARAPVTVVVCTDLARLYELGRRHGEAVGPEHQDLLLTSVVDASLAGMCLALGAESLGLGTVMLGAVRNRPAEVAALLGLPADVTALFGVCLGWPGETPAGRPRMRPDLLVHAETFDDDRARRSVDDDPAALWRSGAAVSDDDAAEWRRQVVRGLQRARTRVPVPPVAG